MHQQPQWTIKTQASEDKVVFEQKPQSVTHNSVDHRLKQIKKKTSLNAKNVKFLKTLGFKVKQNWASKCKKR